MDQCMNEKRKIPRYRQTSILVCTDMLYNASVTLPRALLMPYSVNVHLHDEAASPMGGPYLSNKTSELLIRLDFLWSSLQRFMAFTVLATS